VAELGQLPGARTTKALDLYPGICKGAPEDRNQHTGTASRKPPCSLLVAHVLAVLHACFYAACLHLGRAVKNSTIKGAKGYYAKLPAKLHALNSTRGL
jgi:hypothetical protein